MTVGGRFGIDRNRDYEIFICIYIPLAGSGKRESRWEEEKEESLSLLADWIRFPWPNLLHMSSAHGLEFTEELLRGRGRIQASESTRCWYGGWYGGEDNESRSTKVLWANTDSCVSSLAAGLRAFQVLSWGYCLDWMKRGGGGSSGRWGGMRARHRHRHRRWRKVA